MDQTDKEKVDLWAEKLEVAEKETKLILAEIQKFAAVRNMNENSDIALISDSKDELKKDLKTKTIQERKKFTCNVCCRRFASKISCRKHMNRYHRVETSDKPANVPLLNQHKCPHCEKIYMKTDVLQKHVMKVHEQKDSNLTKIRCEECKETFSNETNLKRHVKTHAKLPETFECDKCRKMFSRRDNLDRHKLRKHNFTNFDIDSMKGSYKNGYVCQMCGFNFAEDLIGLKHHLIQKNCQNVNKNRVIDDCGKYKCEHCQKSYSTFYNLNEHIRWKHATNLNCFKCPNCEKTFKWKKALKVHIKRNHEEEEG